LGALAAIAMVAAISISLAPAHITFSIANATISSSSNTYNLTITDNNTSRWPEVSYDFMSAELWSRSARSYPAEVNTTEALPAGRRRQGPRSTVTFNVSVDYSQYDLSTDKSINSTDVYGWTVLVVAKVRFWIGHVPTRLYTVSGTCINVHLRYQYNASNFPVNCGMY
jgi:hypothetical protein